MAAKIGVPTRILILLCLMYFITYIDRVNFSTAGNVIQSTFKLSNAQFGQVFSAFAIPYLVIQFFGGAIADRFGPRRFITARTSMSPSVPLAFPIVGAL